MTHIGHVDSVNNEFVDDPNFQEFTKTLYLGHAAGSERLYVNIDYIKPGGKSSLYHSHSEQEEFFLILSGTGIVRLNEKEYPIKEGCFFAKPAGKGICHQFINNGNDILKILDCGNRVVSDLITYPDEGVILAKPERKAFRIKDEIKNWSSDPNENKNKNKNKNKG